MVSTITPYRKVGAFYIALTLLRTSRELGDVAADDLTRDMMRITSRGVQPTEEMREDRRVSALPVDRTVAQSSTALETDRMIQRRRRSSRKRGTKRRMVSFS